MRLLNVTLTPRRIRIARAVAIAADALQIAILSLVVGGFISPLDDALDLAVAVIQILLVGWHIAFLPSFIIKELPFADLAPTWTLAVWIATRRGADVVAVQYPACLPNSSDPATPQGQIEQRPDSR